MLYLSLRAAARMLKLQWAMPGFARAFVCKAWRWSVPVSYFDTLFTPDEIAIVTATLENDNKIMPQSFFASRKTMQSSLPDLLLDISS
jgi:hypothetical protein